MCKITVAIAFPVFMDVYICVFVRSGVLMFRGGICREKKLAWVWLFALRWAPLYRLLSILKKSLKHILISFSQLKVHVAVWKCFSRHFLVPPKVSDQVVLCLILVEMPFVSAGLKRWNKTAPRTVFLDKRYIFIYLTRVTGSPEHCWPEYLWRDVVEPRGNSRSSTVDVCRFITGNGPNRLPCCFLWISGINMCFVGEMYEKCIIASLIRITAPWQNSAAALWQFSRQFLPK